MRTEEEIREYIALIERQYRQANAHGKMVEGAKLVALHYALDEPYEGVRE